MSDSTSVAFVGSPGLTLEVVMQAALACDHVRAAAPDEDADIVISINPTGDELRTIAQSATNVITVVDADIDDDIAIDLLLAGADAVVTASDDAAALRRAIDVVRGGEVVLPRALARRLIGRLRGHVPTDTVNLTGRERQILESIARGAVVKQTARALGISEKTVQNLQSGLFKKLDARNRAQAINRAHELNLLDD